MPITVKIQRFNPERDPQPRWEEYRVQADPADKILDVLHAIKWYQDGTLTMRRSCGHGVCGSDAMRINGVNRLACKVLVRDVGNRVVIEPLKGFPVVKDLVVDLDRFFAAYRAVKPYLITKTPDPPKERSQSLRERERFDDTTKCILCAACTTACPSFWANPDYIGPAAIVNAHRFIFDSRDEGAEERLAALNTHDGVWRCRTIFNCQDACPRGIEIPKAIAEVKQTLLRRTFRFSRPAKDIS
ncbi:MAG: succinate dehydrogenase iron-sulfur subunit [Elusimicrobia bacterium]|nr:succinate dehydrogenase iron-sulfur subunit [Elusimicrobiota bacterium]